MWEGETGMGRSDGAPLGADDLSGDSHGLAADANLKPDRLDRRRFCRAAMTSVAVAAMGAGGPAALGAATGRAKAAKGAFRPAQGHSGDTAPPPRSLPSPGSASRSRRGPLPRLTVSSNGHFLVTEAGKPFFYLADTAWELFHSLTFDDASAYLETRAQQGYNAIQAVVLAELNGLTEVGPSGSLPLIDHDLTRPQEPYFRHIDAIVDRAASLGLYTAMLPTWGDKWNKAWGSGPEIFTPESARIYGEWLGRRYRDRPIIWVLGGDRDIQTDRHRAILRAMGHGLRTGDGRRGLLTLHPTGGFIPSDRFPNERFLDFDMIQSGHSAPDIPNYEMITRGWERKPARPLLDGEPNYEDHPINWDPKNGWFDAYNVRKAAYWSVFAGACGHTYGCHDVWQFHGPGRAPVAYARTPWKEALHLPGAGQMIHARRLVESRPYFLREPDQSLIVGNAGAGGEHVQAARGSDGSYAFVYLPTGAPVTIRMSRLTGKRVKVYWFDPRTGDARLEGTHDAAGERDFSPPTHGPGHDWVLTLEDAARRFPAPGRPPKR